VGAIRLKVF